MGAGDHTNTDSIISINTAEGLSCSLPGSDQISVVIKSGGWSLLSTTGTPVPGPFCAASIFAFIVHLFYYLSMFRAIRETCMFVPLLA